MKKINIKFKHTKKLMILIIFIALFSMNGTGWIRTSRISNYVDSEPYSNSTGSYDGSLSIIDSEMSFDVSSDSSISLGNKDYDDKSNSTNNGDTSSDSKEKNNKIIVTTNYTIETLEYENTIKQIEEKTKVVEGYIESSNIEGTSIYTDSSNRRYAYFTVRIPKNKLDEYYKGLDSVGKVVQSQTKSEDVSSTYFDKEARLQTLKIQEERILDILSKSNKLEDILDLEDRLTDIRYEIESITTTLNKINNLVDYSTVEITVKEIKNLDSKSLTIKEASFLEQVKSTVSTTINDFILRVEAIILAIITLSPYLLITAIIYIVLRKRIGKFIRNIIDTTESVSSKDNCDADNNFSKQESDKNVEVKEIENEEADTN